MALFVAAASAQDKKGRGFGGRGGGGFGNDLPTLAANEAVQKDLGLSSDSASKFTSLRDDYRAASQKERQNANINFQDFGNPESQRKLAEITRKLNAEFDPKVKEMVSADQYKRLKQIQLQASLRNLGPSALTAPDLASELKLTDEQKKKLDDLNTEFGRRQRELFTGGNVDQQAFAKLREERTTKTMEVLTAEQKQNLDTLKGSAFDVTQLGGFGGRRGKGN